MPTNEQLETWTALAADALAEKIGPNSTVIIMTMDISEPTKSAWAVEYRGQPVFVVFLKETGCKDIEARYIPKGTRS